MEWLLHLPVLWMGVGIFAATYLIAAAVCWSSTNLTGDRGRLVDPGVLSPLGVVFGLLFVFTAAQVWGDLERTPALISSQDGIFVMADSSHAVEVRPTLCRNQERRASTSAIGH